jgi:hypothetical protein
MLSRVALHPSLFKILGIALSSPLRYETMQDSLLLALAEVQHFGLSKAHKHDKCGNT